MIVKLPVTREQREWVDSGFERLDKALGQRRMLNAEVILPTSDYFPEDLDNSEESVAELFGRICGYMSVDRSRADLEIIPWTEPGNTSTASAAQDDSLSAEEAEATRIAAGPHLYNADDTIMSTEGRKTRWLWRNPKPVIEKDPNIRLAHQRCFGLEAWEDDPTRTIMSIAEYYFDDRLGVATSFAHHLAHVILIGGGLVDKAYADMEQLADLLTIYLGMGIFTANAVVHAYKRISGRGIDTEWTKQGSLTEETCGYALAKFAALRGEEHPMWAEYLSTNVHQYLDRSRQWLLRPYYEDEDEP